MAGHASRHSARGAAGPSRRPTNVTEESRQGFMFESDVKRSLHKGKWSESCGRLTFDFHAGPGACHSDSDSPAPSVQSEGRGVEGQSLLQTPPEASCGTTKPVSTILVLHSVHMPSSLVCFWFSLGLIWVYICLCKPSKLCKLLMSKLCKPGFALCLLFVCTSSLRIYAKFTQ